MLSSSLKIMLMLSKTTLLQKTVLIWLHRAVFQFLFSVSMYLYFWIIMQIWYLAWIWSHSAWENPLTPEYNKSFPRAFSTFKIGYVSSNGACRAPEGPCLSYHKIVIILFSKHTQWPFGNYLVSFLESFLSDDVLSLFIPLYYFLLSWYV